MLGAGGGLGRRRKDTQEVPAYLLAEVLVVRKHSEQQTLCRAQEPNALPTKANLNLPEPREGQGVKHAHGARGVQNQGVQGGAEQE